LRQQCIELAIAHQRFAADQRYVQRLQPIDDVEDAVDKRLALAIRERAQRLRAAQVVVAVGVTTGTPQRALAGDLYGKIGAVAAEDPAPGANNAFHRSNLAQRRAAGNRARPYGRTRCGALRAISTRRT
jgi:hypothetical protein